MFELRWSHSNWIWINWTLPRIIKEEEEKLNQRTHGPLKTEWDTEIANKTNKKATVKLFMIHNEMSFDIHTKTPFNLFYFFLSLSTLADSTTFFFLLLFMGSDFEFFVFISLFSALSFSLSLSPFYCKLSLFSLPFIPINGNECCVCVLHSLQFQHQIIKHM